MKMSQNEISAIDVFGCKGGGLLIDVRTPDEFKVVHAEQAENFPLNELDANIIQDCLDKQGFLPNAPVYVLCQSGRRAQVAADQLGEKGINACVVKGGTEAWVQSSLPYVGVCR